MLAAIDYKCLLDLSSLQNFFLYFYGMLFNLIAVLVVCVWRGQSVDTMFVGQSAVTMLLIANNAAQVRQ